MKSDKETMKKRRESDEQTPSGVHDGSLKSHVGGFIFPFLHIQEIQNFLFHFLLVFIFPFFVPSAALCTCTNTLTCSRHLFLLSKWEKSSEGSGFFNLEAKRKKKTALALSDTPLHHLRGRDVLRAKCGKCTTDYVPRVWLPGRKPFLSLSLEDAKVHFQSSGFNKVQQSSHVTQPLRCIPS